MRKLLIVSIVFVVFATAVGLVWWRTQVVAPQKYTGPLGSISLGIQKTSDAALVYVAQNQRFFQNNGVAVSLKNYNSGVEAIDAMLKGEVNLAWSAELPVVRKAFANEPLKIIATIDKFSDMQLFVRKDKDTVMVSGLKGKHIGLVKGTIAEYYLDNFIEENGLTRSDITIVDVAPEEMVNSILNNTVDGVVAWTPFTNQIKKQLNNKVVSWSLQNELKGYGNLVGGSSWLQTNSNTVSRFLAALSQAEQYIIKNPAESKKIVQKQIGYDDMTMEADWHSTKFFLSLNQALVLAMNNEAQWLVTNKMVNQTEIPNFLDYIYFDALEKVRPEAVTIIYQK